MRSRVPLYARLTVALEHSLYILLLWYLLSNIPVYVRVLVLGRRSFITYLVYCRLLLLLLLPLRRYVHRRRWQMLVSVLRLVWLVMMKILMWISSLPPLLKV